MRRTFEFSLNVFIEFSKFNDKIFVFTVKTHHILCYKPGYFLSTSKTYVRDRNFKLTPVYALVI